MFVALKLNLLSPTAAQGYVRSLAKLAGEELRFSATPDQMRAIISEYSTLKVESILSNHEISERYLVRADGTQVKCPWGQGVVSFAVVRVE